MESLEEFSRLSSTVSMLGVGVAVNPLSLSASTLMENTFRLESETLREEVRKSLATWNDVPKEIEKLVFDSTSLHDPISSESVDFQNPSSSSLSRLALGRVAGGSPSLSAINHRSVASLNLNMDSSSPVDPSLDISHVLEKYSEKLVDLVMEKMKMKQQESTLDALYE